MLEEQPQAEDENLPTIASISPSSRFRPPTSEEKPTAAVTPSSASPPSLDPKAPTPVSEAGTDSPEALEEEASQQGAFNEETGEINWDCPCLGGMAHGPCGEEFRAAFSCFVFSKEEPKGMDCIENFKGMQECFRRHPEIYGPELEDDDEEAQAMGPGEEAAVAAASLPEDTPGVATAEGALAKEKAAAPEAKVSTPPTTWNATSPAPPKEKRSIYDSEDEKGSEPLSGIHDTGKQGKLLKDSNRATSTAHPDADLAEDQLVPKATHDATDSNRK